MFLDFIANHWWLWIICVVFFTILAITLAISQFFSKSFKSFFAKFLGIALVGIINLLSWGALITAIVVQIIRYASKSS